MSNSNINRRKSNEVKVGNVLIGGDNPIVVQSMTDTNTSDIEKTTNQILELAKAGSEIVRVTVNDADAIQAIPYIKDNIQKLGLNIPLVGDFHFNGHILLNKYQSEASHLDKFRINPGNVGKKNKKDKNFATMIEVACKLDKPVRIGVNWGSLDQDLLADKLDFNNKLDVPKSLDDVMCDVVIASALENAKLAESIGMNKNKIIISCKLSKVNMLIDVYQKISKMCDYALHLGLTEAGSNERGIVYSSCALGPLLLNGIGDTIRVSLTTDINGNRSREVDVAKLILQSLGIRYFLPDVTSCPGCGRTSSDYFQKLAFDIDQHIKKSMPIWKEDYPGVENLKISVMGCIVNGPGESKHADIGISLPGRGENPTAPVYIDGEKKLTLKGDNITNDFKKILIEYIDNRFRQ
ncbi:MAG: flavodoxin-dependent (E)-4-hydroxy-3-methylbut-2-enyl-diphosphate synthase [Gammaproteobacteria bacterium]|jgi:(E)-4-hydroxy-3-methylbut-2-enyl-diphosphate synthase|nr:flavodoxin-dependent (E)-4-hydroxy-3-methylbut-2-enyl-diphosphate synthase [Gammaproteobacteria bacterium]|tara:strand:- start:1060 stop:2283 length:1224 start_codon:yes stop_codon:yes gene_type:complete